MPSMMVLQVPRSIWNTDGSTVRTTPFDLDNQINTNFSPGMASGLDMQTDHSSDTLEVSHMWP